MNYIYIIAGLASGLMVTYKISVWLGMDLKNMSRHPFVDKHIWPRDGWWEFRHAMNWFLFDTVIFIAGSYVDNRSGGHSSTLSLLFSFLIQMPISFLMLYSMYMMLKRRI